jgi:hypothetical protein
LIKAELRDMPHNTAIIKQISKSIVSITKQSKRIITNEYSELQLN